jgi:hypothetical protein
MTSYPIPIPDWAAATHVPPEELARRQGVRPIADLRDLACPELFESDEELDEFITYTYAARQADLD